MIILLFVSGENVPLASECSYFCRVRDEFGGFGRQVVFLHLNVFCIPAGILFDTLFKRDLAGRCSVAESSRLLIRKGNDVGLLLYIGKLQTS